MLRQISLFSENNRGTLQKITNVLSNADINIYSMLANDSAEFGIIRIIVDNPDKALTALRDAGYQCRIDTVIAVKMADTPGSLDKILKALSDANVSLSYLYISYDRESNAPVAIFKADDPEAETFLEGIGCDLVTSMN
jgi:hypothetical protein